MEQLTGKEANHAHQPTQHNAGSGIFGHLRAGAGRRIGGGGPGPTGSQRGHLCCGRGGRCRRAGPPKGAELVFLASIAGAFCLFGLGLFFYLFLRPLATVTRYFLWQRRQNRQSERSS